MKFKVGDKVRAKDGLVDRKSYNGVTLYPDMKDYITGKTLTVTVAVNNVIKIEGSVLWYGESVFDLVDPEPIVSQPMEKLVIYRDGDKTIAKYYKGDKVVTASATFCSCDNYDFKQGVVLTTESVFNKMEEEEVGYSWVKCVGYRTTDNFNFTIDKKYKIYDNGRIIDDSGFVFRNTKTKKDMLDFLSEFFIFEEVENPS